MPLDRADAANNVPNRKPSPLAEPITVHKFSKNRRRVESVHFTLSEYEGHALVSIRIYATGTDGIDRPTAKGVSMAVGKLPELIRGIAKTEAKAREIGLLIDGGSE